MNLPESLERLEISPEKSECCKLEDSHPTTQHRPSTNNNDEPEKILETLSINAVCPKGNCSCNMKRDMRGKGLKRLVNKRPILRRSKLSQAVLRAPVLRLPSSTSAELSSTSPPLAATAEGIRPLTALLPGPSASRLEDDSEPSSPVLVSSERRNPSAAQSTCAIQARLTAHAHPSPSTSDDTSMDELASYFDIFVHIPKKMSQMAEMMYI